MHISIATDWYDYDELLCMKDQLTAIENGWAWPVDDFLCVQEHDYKLLPA